MKPYLNNLLASTLAVFAPIHMILVVVGVVIFADLFTGIWAAKKRGEAITSDGLKKTVEKMFRYHAAIILGFLIETYLIGGIIPITKIVTGMIGITEALSLFENLNAISGNGVFDGVVKLLGAAKEQKQKEIKNKAVRKKRQSSKK